MKLMFLVLLVRRLNKNIAVHRQVMKVFIKLNYENSDYAIRLVLLIFFKFIGNKAFDNYED
jgi:hypothetical protein